jgi:hypothetical protein
MHYIDIYNLVKGPLRRLHIMHAKLKVKNIGNFTQSNFITYLYILHLFEHPVNVLQISLTYLG